MIIFVFVSILIFVFAFSDTQVFVCGHPSHQDDSIDHIYHLQSLLFGSWGGRSLTITCFSSISTIKDKWKLKQMKNVNAKLERQKKFCCCAMCHNGKCSGSARYQATLTVIYFSLSPTHPHCNNIPPHTNISYQSPNTYHENKDNLWYKPDHKSFFDESFSKCGHKWTLGIIFLNHKTNYFRKI